MKSSDISKAIWIPVLIGVVIAAVVLTIPSHSHDIRQAHEAAAAATLKSGIFAAEVQFQAEAMLDQDGNGTGEYALLSELGGLRAVGRCAPGQLRFLPGPLAAGAVAVHYRYAVFLPDGAGGALSEPAGSGPRPAAGAAAAAQQERQFVAYGWPDDAEAGRYAFAIMEDGVVRKLPWTGQPPAWNALFGGKGWGATPVWPANAR